METNVIQLEELNVSEEEMHTLYRMLYQDEFEKVMESALYEENEASEEQFEPLTIEELENAKIQLEDAISEENDYIEGYTACHSEEDYNNIKEIQNRLENGESVDLTQKERLSLFEVLQLDSVMEARDENMEKLSLIDKVIEQVQQPQYNEKQSEHQGGHHNEPIERE